MVKHHVLLITFPAQGHINPSLQFAKRLRCIGVRVTFATSISTYHRMTGITNSDGLTFAEYSDGYDNGFKPGDDLEHYMSELKRRGSESLAELISNCANKGLPVTCLVYTLLLPWAAEVARALHVPSALLWIQPATVFDIYYYYSTENYGNMIREKTKDPSCFIELPGLPLLTSRDLPSFLVPSNAYKFALTSFQEQMEALAKETNPKLLINTFNELEPEALKAVDKVTMIPIGPLIPSAFLDGKDPSDNSFGGDLFRRSDGYMDWLDSKPKSTVIYVSFGSFSVLSKRQMEEVEIGLLETGRPFLWVIRGPEKEEEKEEDKLISRKEELEKQGMIVRWCSQVEVLSHPAVGCFFSHCGWNSTVESLVSGVPVVAFPQWTDQGTNAKLVEDVWKTGVRVTAVEGGGGIVEGGEIKRCLEMVMEDGEMRWNAKKWKELAREAVRESGSSYKNLKAFVDEIGLLSNVNQ